MIGEVASRHTKSRVLWFCPVLSIGIEHDPCVVILKEHRSFERILLDRAYHLFGTVQNMA